MKLFLSSFDRQGMPPELRDFVGQNLTCAVVANSNDAETPDVRAEVLGRTSAALQTAGFQTRELDLRQFQDDGDGIARALRGCGLVWAVGGNALVLRVAMRRSGFDAVIRSLLAEGDLTYGGSSAGALVAGASLRGVELVDPLDDLGAAPPIWDGLALVDFTIVPHYRTTGPMGPGIEAWAAGLERGHIAHRTLRDGQSLEIHDSEVRLVDHAVEAELFSASRPHSH